MSASLARLRRHFGDELLTRVGNQYMLTPLAAELRERTWMALAGVERVFSAQREFDPASLTREFSLMVSDYGEAVLATAVADRLARQAPRARVRLLGNVVQPLDRADARMLSTDLVIMPHGFVTDLHSQDLYQDEWVCLVAAANEAVGQALTVEHLQALPWVATFHSSVGTTHGMTELRLKGIEPYVQVVTDHFLTVPGHVAGSERIALLPLIRNQGRRRCATSGCASAEDVCGQAVLALGALGTKLPSQGRAASAETEEVIAMIQEAEQRRSCQAWFAGRSEPRARP